MQNNTMYLHPITVNRLQFAMRPNKKNSLTLTVKTKYSFKIVQLHKDDDWRCAIIRCELNVFPKDEDVFSLRIDCSAIFECKIDSEMKNNDSLFENTINDAGVNFFNIELKRMVANITRDFGLSELQI